MRGLDLKALDMMQAVQLLWFQSFFSVGFTMLVHVYVYLVDGSGAGNTPNYNFYSKFSTFLESLCLS